MPATSQYAWRHDPQPWAQPIGSHQVHGISFLDARLSCCVSILDLLNVIFNWIYRWRRAGRGRRLPFGFAREHRVCCESMIATATCH